MGGGAVERKQKVVRKPGKALRNVWKKGRGVGEVKGKGREKRWDFQEGYQRRRKLLIKGR